MSMLVGADKFFVAGGHAGAIVCDDEWWGGLGVYFLLGLSAASSEGQRCGKGLRGRTAVRLLLLEQAAQQTTQQAGHGRQDAANQVQDRGQQAQDRGQDGAEQTAQIQCAAGNNADFRLAKFLNCHD